MSDQPSATPAEDRAAVLIAEARRQIAEVESDERYRRPTATTDVNAGLALAQVQLGTRRACWRYVLELLGEPAP